MKPHSFKMPDSLVARAKDKAGMIPLSRIVRRLIEKWLNGEIKLD